MMAAMAACGAAAAHEPRARHAAFDTRAAPRAKICHAMLPRCRATRVVDA